MYCLIVSLEMTKVISRTSVRMTENEWEAETDVSLFQALRGHKPIGIGKHFHMLCIMVERAQIKQITIVIHNNFRLKVTSD